MRKWPRCWHSLLRRIRRKIRIRRRGGRRTGREHAVVLFCGWEGGEEDGLGCYGRYVVRMHGTVRVVVKFIFFVG